MDDPSVISPSWLKGSDGTCSVRKRKTVNQFMFSKAEFHMPESHFPLCDKAKAPSLSSLERCSGKRSYFELTRNMESRQKQHDGGETKSKLLQPSEAVRRSLKGRIVYKLRTSSMPSEFSLTRREEKEQIAYQESIQFLKPNISPVHTETKRTKSFMKYSTVETAGAVVLADCTNNLNATSPKSIEGGLDAEKIQPSNAKGRSHLKGRIMANYKATGISLDSLAPLFAKETEQRGFPATHSRFNSLNYYDELTKKNCERACSSITGRAGIVPTEDLSERDVLFSKLDGPNQDGNRALLETIQKTCPRYIESSPCSKRELIETIIHEVHHKGGRFLQLLGSDWVIVTSEGVTLKRKIHQLFVLQGQNYFVSAKTIKPVMTLDVIFSRGRGEGEYAGNDDYGHFLHQSAIVFDQATDDHQHLIAYDIVQKILLSGGRFLRLEDKASLVCMSEKQARRKTCSMLFYVKKQSGAVPTC